MAELNNTQKQALARDLYLAGQYTYEEIAEKVGVQRQTVSRWAKAGNWSDLKAGMTVSREEILKRMYQQIDNMNAVILDREPGERIATTKEADIMVKLSAAIKSMETDVGIADIVSVGTRFIEFIRKVDLDKAKEIIGYWDAFLKDSIK